MARFEKRFIKGKVTSPEPLVGDAPSNYVGKVRETENGTLRVHSVNEDGLLLCMFRPNNRNMDYGMLLTEDDFENGKFEFFDNCFLVKYEKVVDKGNILYRIYLTNENFVEITEADFKNKTILDTPFLCTSDIHISAYERDFSFCEQGSDYVCLSYREVDFITLKKSEFHNFFNKLFFERMELDKILGYIDMCIEETELQPLIIDRGLVVVPIAIEKGIVTYTCYVKSFPFYKFNGNTMEDFYEGSGFVNACSYLMDKITLTMPLYDDDEE